MSESTNQDILGRPLVTKQECQRRVEQARTEERERCARLAMATFNPKQPEDADYDWGYNDAKRDIAAAIHNADLEVE